MKRPEKKGNLVFTNYLTSSTQFTNQVDIL